MSISQVGSKLLCNESFVNYYIMSAKVSNERYDIPFEDSLTELQNILELLENGEGRLEDMIVNYERGIKLITHCRSLFRICRMLH